MSFTICIITRITSPEILYNIIFLKFLPSRTRRPDHDTPRQSTHGRRSSSAARSGYNSLCVLCLTSSAAAAASGSLVAPRSSSRPRPPYPLLLHLPRKSYSKVKYLPVLLVLLTSNRQVPPLHGQQEEEEEEKKESPPPWTRSPLYPSRICPRFLPLPP